VISRRGYTRVVRAAAAREKQREKKADEDVCCFGCCWSPLTHVARGTERRVRRLPCASFGPSDGAATGRR
jgi:hypothetical protein